MIVVQNEQCNAVKLGTGDDYEFAIQITNDATTVPEDQRQQASQEDST